MGGRYGKYGDFKRKEKLRNSKKNRARKNPGIRVDKKERRRNKRQK